MIPNGLAEWAEKRAIAIWGNLQTDHLWQRMLKNTIATSIAIVIALLPAVVRVYGKASYLGPIATVFGHPGRRFGMMAEALVLAIAGTLVGMGWSVFGVYLSSLVYHTNPPAAYTIKGVFLLVAFLTHGFLRSHTPRLFIFVLLLIIVSVVSLTGTAKAVTKTAVTQILYPILTASGVLLLVNITIFPEFSSSFLGVTTIETLGETVGVLRDAGKYFIKVAGTAETQAESKDTKAQNEVSGKPGKDGKEDGSISFLQRSLAAFHKRQKDKHNCSLPMSDTITATIKLKTLTAKKASLRAKLASCKAAQQECNFELAFAVLPPRDMKPISDTAMKGLVANTIALVGACESRYALIGDKDEENEVEDKANILLEGAADGANVGTRDEGSHPGSGAEDSHPSADEKTEKRQRKRNNKNKKKRKTLAEKGLSDLELIKPRKEIEFGDVELLKNLVRRLAKPIVDLQDNIDSTVDAVTSCLAYCYDVPKLPSGARPPKGIELQEIDIRVDILTDAMVTFDLDTAKALEGAAALHHLDQPQVDIMPRMETFLISSFLLNLRQAALHTLEMLKHARVIVEKRQARHGRRRIYAPRINWRKWLVSGGEEDMLALPGNARQDMRTGNMKDDPPDREAAATSKESLLAKKDMESVPPKDSQSSKPVSDSHDALKQKSKESKKGSLSHRFRNGFADFLEYMSGSDDVAYAFKITIAAFLVTWPAFLNQWNTWYSLNRGLWAALQLVLITEVAIGTSVVTFSVRAVGTTIGCLWGYAAYEARHGNRVVCVVMLVVGIIPSTYVQLGTKYVKAGMVSIISMSVVALSTVDKTVPGTATENFLRRLIAFLIGGVVALLVEVIFFPVRARDRLVESLAASLRQISEMEACLAHGVETGTNVDVQSEAIIERFDRAKRKAQGALSAAETFLPFCANEPRLKGSFAGLALIYGEILYVLHSIVDRMDNMLHLRREYGSGVLEEFNSQVYPYRRNVAGSITLALFAVHEALTTKLPLPQFLPSARIAHLRMINRVREVVLQKAPGDSQEFQESTWPAVELGAAKLLVQRKFLSWNATSAGLTEVIEFLEELIDLTKLLVGANEFRSGMLTRPTYRDYINRRERGLSRSMSQPMSGNQEKSRGSQDREGDGNRDETMNTIPELEKQPGKLGFSRRRTTFTRRDIDVGTMGEAIRAERLGRQTQTEEAELPRSLQRVRTRRIEEMNLRLEKKKTINDEAERRQGKSADKSQ